MKIIFCNLCRKRIIPPKFLSSGNIKLGEKSKIKVNCSDPNCKGNATIKAQKNEVQGNQT